MSIIVAILNIAFIAFISYRVWFKDQSPLKIIFWPALLLKLLAGIALGFVYTYYYTIGDTFNYFDDGVKLAGLARHDARAYIGFLWSGDESFAIWSELIYKQPRAMFLSKITSLFCIWTADSYWVVSLYFSAISFFATWVLAKKIIVLVPNTAIAVILAFFFFPSAVFWSAGVIKESLAMAALLFVCYIFLRVWMRERIRFLECLLAVFSLWILWNLKYYYVAVFVPVALTALIARWLFSRLKLESLPVKVLLWFTLLAGPLLLVTVLHPNFYPERFMEVIVSSYYEYQAISSVEDVIHFNSFEATPTSFLKNIPMAILSGMYRPFFTEAHTTLQLVAATENLLLLILTIGAITKIRMIVNSDHRLLIFSLLIYIVLLCIFLALSTPNFGTLSRYRIGFLPFFVLLLASENPLVTRFIKPKWLNNLAP
jgi:hypothetical protein